MTYVRLMHYALLIAVSCFLIWLVKVVSDFCSMKYRNEALKDIEENVSLNLKCTVSILPITQDDECNEILMSVPDGIEAYRLRMLYLFSVNGVNVTKDNVRCYDLFVENPGNVNYFEIDILNDRTSVRYPGMKVIRKGGRE